MFIVNFIGFNLVWFGLVYWGDTFIPIAAAFFGGHIYYAWKSGSSEIKLIFTVAAIGIVVDSILQTTGVFIFPENSYLPFWLVALWLCFATTLSHSLKYLSKSRGLQGVVGMLFAPMSYLVGHKLNAVNFGMTVFETYALLSIIWGILMVVFFYIKTSLIKIEVDKLEVDYE